MTHVYHQGKHAILLDSNEMNDLLVSLERGRSNPTKASPATAVTDLKASPSQRVAGADDEEAPIITINIFKFYSEIVEIAEKVKP